MNKQELVKQQPKFSVAIQGDTYKNLINNTLGDKEKAQRFIAAISSAVAVNPTLQDCEARNYFIRCITWRKFKFKPISTIRILLPSSI